MPIFQVEPAGVDDYGGPFPFVRPSSDLYDLLADFWLSHDRTDAALPLRVSWLRGLCRAREECDSSGSSASPVNEADLVVRDATGAVVFDSRDSDEFSSAAWSADYWVFRWRKGLASCVAVARRGRSGADGYRVYPYEIEPADGVLDERCHGVLPDRLDALIVNGVRLEGAVVFEEGYNLSIAATRVDGVRHVNRLTLGAAPGSGEGVFPDCVSPEPVLRTINQVGPDASGNVNLSATDCYRWDRPTAVAVVDGVRYVEPEEGALALRNDCPPCCTCEDYLNTHLGMQRLYDKYKQLGLQLDNSRNLFVSNRERWLAYRDCRNSAPARTDVSGPIPRVADFAASWTNTSPECQYAVRLVMTLTHSRGIASSLVAGASFRTVNDVLVPYLPTGSWNVYVAEWPVVRAGETVRFRGRLRFADFVAGDALTVVAAPYVSGAPQPVSITTKPLGPVT